MDIKRKIKKTLLHTRRNEKAM